MKNEVCVFCYGLENGKPVSLCSRCVQKLLIASPEKIAAMKRADNVTEAQLRYLNSLSEDEEVNYEFKTREVRGNMGRKRTGRTSRSSRSQKR
jgi:hypothetical protein